jgi:ATP phosphoribosyltransferase regulatory subunit
LIRLGCGLEARYGEAAGVLAPWSDDPDLGEAVARLRAAGRKVVAALPGAEVPAQALGCGEVLRLRDGGWVVEPA